MGATRFGKYLVFDRIAQGGMAEIHRAVLRGAAGFVKVVALKRILPVTPPDPELDVLFQDEARIASTLAHGNIAQVFEYGEEDGTPFLAMELVEGTDVAGLMAALAGRGRRLPTAAALFIAAEAAHGLAHAHAQRTADGRPLGIVHRDISPQNILVSRGGDVKITDFGIAKAFGKAHRTASGVVLGKLHYMAPEQLAGDREVDGRADVFSLAVVLHEMLTGAPLYPPRAPGGAAIRPEEIHARPIEPPSRREPAVPAEVDAVCLHALALAPEARIAGAAELARELSRLLHERFPGFSRADLAELVSEIVPALPPLEIPPPGSEPARQLDIPTRSIAGSDRVRRRKWRRLSASAWVGVALSAVIVVSMAIVLFRLLLPGREAPVVTPDAAVRLVDAAAAEPAPTGAFTLRPTAPEAEPELAARIRGFDVARRGVPGDEYAAFLSALDHRIAHLTVDGDGRAQVPEPLPPVLAQRLGKHLEAVDAVTAYVAATGRLPRPVADALRSFLGNYPAYVPVETLAVGVRLPPVSATALALWQKPDDAGRLAQLAVANELGGRWCDPPAAPARHFAPQLCERDALFALLPAGDRTAAAFLRWERALEEGVVGGAAVRIRAQNIVEGDRPEEIRIEVTVEDGGADGLGYTLAAGGLGGERTPIASARPSPGVTTMAFRAPRLAHVPVLVARRAGQQVELRLGSPRY